MIINHRYKFIFFKTRKTAGTSIEIALSQFCDKNDVITRITKEDEKKRRKLGFPGPQNYITPLKHYQKADWINLIKKAQPKSFQNHSTAAFIKKNIPEEIWENYYKFTFERNPFDKAISRYYWSTRFSDSRISITNYLNTAEIYLLSNWENYTINDHIVMDFVGFYENLNDDLEKVQKKLGLPSELKLPQTKSNYRKNKDHYSNLLDAEARSRIEIVCAKEIRAFDYHWKQAKENGIK